MAIFLFFFVFGKIADGQYNRWEEHDYGQMSPQLEKLHESLFIGDWHADNLLWDRDPLARLEHGHVDIPRLIEGNIALQVFDAVIKTPRNLNYYKNSDATDNVTPLVMANRWPMKTWSSLYERAIYQSHRLHLAEERSEDRLKIIKTSGDLSKFILDRSLDADKVGGLLAIEGLHALEGDLSNLLGLYDAGFRIMGLVHFFDNEVGGSSAGMLQKGLTHFGDQVIRAMNQKDIIIDLAHASTQLIDDVLELTDRPVIVSHTGLQAIHDSPRNLSDQQALEIAKSGGLICIGYWEGAIGSTLPQDIARTIRYAVDLVGAKHVSLGSDWDGATTTYFDAANIWVLTRALKDQNMSEEDIKLVMGENMKRFLLEHLPR